MSAADDLIILLTPKLQTETHVGPWLTIDQERIDRFAEVTGDVQWIHTDPERARRESPYGGTVAHGYLTLALGPLLIAETLHVEELTAAIARGDVARLTKIHGVGKKTAERVILELSNKIAELPGEDQGAARADSEAIEALASLGYSVSQAREALKAVPESVKDVSERVRAALKSLGK